MAESRKIIRRNHAVYVKAETGSSLLSSQCDRIEFDQSPVPSHEFIVAIGKLSELDNSPQLRQDAISNGKAIIANWKPPTEEQIDKIIDNMKRRLMA